MGEQVIKQVIVALFPTVDGAQQGRELLEAEKKAISLVNTAVIRMTAEGKVEVKENTGLSARLHGADFPNDQLKVLGLSLIHILLVERNAEAQALQDQIAQLEAQPDSNTETELEQLKAQDCLLYTSRCV